MSVYFIACGGFIKVGFSENPERRAAWETLPREEKGGCNSALAERVWRERRQGAAS